MDELAKAPIGREDSGSAQFAEVHKAEIDSINQRRRRLGRAEVREFGPPAARVYDTVGLALSGGGIRSAAFSLGVLQALDHHGVLKKVDYLSTVSGGGYTGASLSATMTASKGEFVFRGSDKDRPANMPVSPEVSDTEAVGHLRNYSNYLIPAGLRDVLTAVAIIVRGLVANFALVFPVVLALAALTIISNPNRTSLLQPDLFGLPLHFIPVENFGITLALALIGLALFFLWALYRSFLAPEKLSEFRNWLPTLAAGYLVLVALAFFCEIQTFVVAGMFDIADGGGFFSYLAGMVKALAAITAPIAAAVIFFRNQLGVLLKNAGTSSKLSTKAAAVAGKAAIWLAGLALPLLIWVAYLYLCYWGIINDFVEWPASGEHTPYWLLKASEAVSNLYFGRVVERPMAFLYFVVALISFVLALLLRPNANSLHRLYRDRLSKAFLFDPTAQSEPGSMDRNKASIDQKRDFAPLDTMRLSALSPLYAPFHLINAALNIQGSDYANRRGRNADFFLLSANYVGSFATGYAPTTDFEKAARDLDLATAMAISGAAASSNMGAKSIKPLTATLALLNIRLGYWMKNPRYAGKNNSAFVPKSPQYLFAEITGRLYENSNEIYITDGGHIENLGIYELLRRRCGVIVCVDAEADPEMRFGAFITLQRYARIDLGVRFEMPWAGIRAATLGAMSAGHAREQDPAEPACGPHISIGTIDYGNGATGHLVYIKSSLTGDENDYIRDYARRHGQFPHETTGDQFFSEEQFEVYRALAFHAVHGTLCGRDGIEVDDATELLTFKDEVNEKVKAVHDALM